MNAMCIAFKPSCLLICFMHNLRLYLIQIGYFLKSGKFAFHKVI